MSKNKKRVKLVGIDIDRKPRRDRQILNLTLTDSEAIDKLLALSKARNEAPGAVARKLLEETLRRYVVFEDEE